MQYNFGMFVKKRRLRRKKDITLVLKEGNQVQGKYFRLRFTKRAPELPCRVTIVVSSKQHKQATVRNRLKRRSREATKKALNNLESYDIIIFPLKKAQNALFSDLVKELIKHVFFIKNNHRSYNVLPKNRLPKPR